eukprot:scaffold4121_cov73-Skeletonema_marinoi.AAC.5
MARSTAPLLPLFNLTNTHMTSSVQLHKPLNHFNPAASALPNEFLYQLVSELTLLIITYIMQVTSTSE